MICDLDVKRTEQGFIALGMKNFDPSWPGAPGETIFSAYERGAMTSPEFRDAIRKFLPPGVADSAIDEAWNAMLQEIPPARVRLLEQLRTRYRIFLLSNSNEIHYACYSSRFRDQYGYADFDQLFEKAWFSFRLKMQKPDREIFEFVIAQGSLSPSQTLFIDDTQKHVDGAAAIGIKSLLLGPGQDITGLFSSVE